MHTTELTKVRVHHNGDYSGDVIFVRKDTGTEFTVPMADVLQLAGDYVRDEIIRLVEDADAHDLLGVVPRLIVRKKRGR